MVALKPPYSMFQVVLLAPPLLALWLALSYSDFVPSKAKHERTGRPTDKNKPE